MPLAKYNKSFGGSRGAAAKAHAAMVKTYGAKTGEQVFYATANTHKGGGMFDPTTHTPSPDVHDQITQGECLDRDSNHGIEHYGTVPTGSLDALKKEE